MYDTADGVERYVAMAEGHDGGEHVAVLASLLPAGSRVLELGMGPGTDLALLAEHFTTVGSDRSPVFVERYRAAHPEADVRRVDAVTIDLDDGPFDAVYSNKVLHHLRRPDLVRSLQRQAELLRPDGVAVHTLWWGTDDEIYGDMEVHNHTCEALADLVPSPLVIEDCRRYQEFEPEDSIRLVLRRRA